jgi:GTP cyclohydrolase I
MTEKINANGNKPLTSQQKKEKKEKLETIFTDFLKVLDYDIENDPNIKETPHRMAKMWIDELLEGNFSDPPKITVFPNEEHYDQIVISGPIKVDSVCSHHGITIAGKCWIGYLPGDKVIGISKFSRIVRFFSRRMQLQEGMTQQIADYIENLMNPKGVIVFMKCKHYCEIARGVREESIFMTTSAVRGTFRVNGNARQEFFSLIQEGN